MSKVVIAVAAIVGVVLVGSGFGTLLNPPTIDMYGHPYNYGAQAAVFFVVGALCLVGSVALYRVEAKNSRK